jgi:hypothetical protein
MDDYMTQSNGIEKTESGEVDSRTRLSVPLKSSDAETHQSSNTQKTRKKKKKVKLQEFSELSCRAPAHVQPVPLMFNKCNHKKVSGKKFQRACRQSDEPEQQVNPAISDARLRAYGINPKRFKNKLKYGNK